MKVFEVTTIRFKKNSKETIDTVQYVTSTKNTLLSVVDYFTKHCEQYEEALKGVREVLVIAQNITQQ